MPDQSPKTYKTEIKLPRPDSLGGGEWKLSKLTEITALFGKNGSGKSLLLRAWRDVDHSSYHYVVPERTGEITYDANLSQQQMNAQTRRDQSQGNVGGRYRQQIVSRIPAYLAARGNDRTGAPTGNPQEIEQLLSTLVPEFAVKISDENPPYVLTRLSTNKPVGGIEELSSGEAQLLTLALDILMIAAIWELKKTATRVMLVDEPDAHIHPDLQVRFADFLVRAATRYDLQLVIATHSTTMLAALGQFAKGKASVIYLDRTRTIFESAPFTAVLQELAACLGGHALMGPLFSIPILLVEGDDDYRIWSQVPRHHVVSFAVIPSHGEQIKQYQRTLERLFSALREDARSVSGFALVDGDKGKPQANVETPQTHIRFIQLACRESENLYLTDEVLTSIGTTWDAAAKKIAEQAKDFGQKAEIIEEVSNGDRAKGDLKPVIEELSAILDPKRVHWTVRVAHAIGAKRPSGQLADFLGDEVVAALWGTPPSEPPAEA